MKKLNHLAVIIIFCIGFAGCASAGKSLSSGLPDAGPKTASGGYHNLVLLNDDNVWAWGRNTFGQIGDETHSDRSAAVRVESLTEIKAIAAGEQHSLALKSDGTVWAWGQNNHSQLGLGSAAAEITKPSPVPSLSGIIAISACKNHSLALKSDGTVWRWGEFYRSGGHTDIPEMVSGLSGIIAIADGAEHGVALKKDNTVWTWGKNWAGQLGTGTTADNPVPARIPGLAGIVKIAAGGYHTLALKSDGTLWGAGLNENGQIGDNTTTDRPSPVLVRSAGDIAYISAGDEHSAAIASDGTLFTWGQNTDGQLGTGEYNGNISAPARIKDRVIAASAGITHTSAIDADNNIWAWGGNSFGQTGNGARLDGLHIDKGSPVPAQVKVRVPESF